MTPSPRPTPAQAPVLRSLRDGGTLKHARRENWRTHKTSERVELTVGEETTPVAAPTLPALERAGWIEAKALKWFPFSVWTIYTLTAAGRAVVEEAE